MAQTSKDWPIILDETSYTHLVELSHSLSKVDGLIKKLVDGEYQQWNDKNDKLSQDSQKWLLHHSWVDWRDNNKSNNANNNNWPDWDSTGTGEASNDTSNNFKYESNVQWNDGWNSETNWSNDTSKSETSIDWDTTKLSGWEKGLWETEWLKLESKESNQEKMNWGTSDLSEW